MKFDFCTGAHAALDDEGLLEERGGLAVFDGLGEVSYRDTLHGIGFLGLREG